MPTKKIAAVKKAAPTQSAAKKAAPAAKKAAAKKAAQPVTAATFRTKIDLANLAVGAKTVKQLARAVTKLAQTLAKMDENGAVKLEQPVTAKGALLATTDAKAAKRFGMEEGRAPRAAKTAAPAAKKTAGATQTAAAPAPAKKAAAKRAAAKKTRAQAAPTDAAPAAEAVDVTVVAKRAAQNAAAKKAPAKKAAGKKTARKTSINGSKEPARAAGGESAAAPEAAPATDVQSAEAAES
jgi:hypothetical protein